MIFTNTSKKIYAPNKSNNYQNYHIHTYTILIISSWPIICRAVCVWFRIMWHLNNKKNNFVHFLPFDCSDGSQWSGNKAVKNHPQTHICRCVTVNKDFVENFLGTCGKWWHCPNYLIIINLSVISGRIWTFLFVKTYIHNFTYFNSRL